MKQVDAVDFIAEEILGLATLETRNSDRLDFKELHVARIKQALMAAYEIAYKAGQENKKV